MLWAFTDCLAKRSPALITEDRILIGCDPVSGRAQEVNLCWEQLCLAELYDIELAKDADFVIMVVDLISEADCGGFRPAEITQPCAYFPAGGMSFSESALAFTISGNLECGHTYYWRVKVRDCTTGQEIRSPWSDARSFTIKAGLSVITPYYSPHLLAPENGCLGCPVTPASFSWSPFKETTKYKLVLATDAAMTQVVTEADVNTTAFEYDGTLSYSTNYFWRVQALEPAPSDWSATFSFHTEATPTTLQTGTASKSKLLDLLATPIIAMLAWMSAPQIHLIPPLPLVPSVWVVTAIIVALFVAWLVVMITISKLLRK
jgi:hypothetical protein